MHPSRRQARIATFVFFFISGFGFSTWASRIPTIQQQLHLNEASLGAVLFAMPIGLMLTLPLTGYLLQRFSSRHVMFAGAIMFNGMLALLGFVTQTWQLVVVLFCFGSSRNLFNISLNAQSVSLQAMYDRSIIATFHGVWSLAGFGGAALGSLMVSFGVATSWHFLAVGTALVALIFSFFPYSINDAPSPHQRKASFILPDKYLLKYGLISFTSMACEGTMYDWSAIYLKKAVHASKEMATAGFAVYMIAMTLGRLTGDRLANQLGIKTMLQYSGMLICLGLVVAVAFPYPIMAGIGYVMVGFGVSCVIPMVFSMAGKSSTMSSGPAIAAVSTVGYFGFLIVPPVVGFVAETASLRWSFGLIACMGALMTVIVSRLHNNTAPGGS